ncbi:MAG: hypothetical protein PHX18_04700 [Candidatus Gastranaerophilales bacterium]|nr:hypothetical protein [Candidatus Gastranaerophilales bacterium]
MSENTSVKFDPGFAPYVLAFGESYDYIEGEVRKFKNISQRKQKYKALEPSLFRLADNVAAFYLGCMLYAAYLNLYFDEAKSIEGNDFYGLDEEYCRSSEVTAEVKSLAKFLTMHEKSPFATQKINPVYKIIVAEYENFLDINHYFVNIKTTKDLKLPKLCNPLKKYSKAELEEVLNTIEAAIKAGQIENLLTSKYIQLAQ